MACKNNNSKYTFERACNALGLPETWGTTDDKQVTIEYTPCLGLCDRWPNVKICNDNWRETIYNRINSNKMWDLIEPFKKHKNKN